MTGNTRILVLALAVTGLVVGCGGASRSHQIDVERWAPAIDDWAAETHKDLQALAAWWGNTNTLLDDILEAGCEAEKKHADLPTPGMASFCALLAGGGGQGDPPIIDPPRCDFGNCPPN